MSAAIALHNELLGVEVVHHDVGGLFVHESRIPAGLKLPKHVHDYDHLSVLVSGSVVLSIDGHATMRHGYEMLTIEAGKQHEVHAVTDVVWLCMHAKETALASAKPPSKIRLLERGVNVAPLLLALQVHPELWNAHVQRTKPVDSPHREVDDIWVRYSESGEIEDSSHDSAWYPAARVLPVRDLIFPLMAMVDGERLGGVLITRIPAGKQCYPHVDESWHASYYGKFAIQIAAAPGQAFCFEGEQLETAPGDIFTFDNSFRHWVTNPTPYDRITLIACIKAGGV